LSVQQIRSLAPTDRTDRLKGVQMFVNPRECIGCWACIPVCPVNAIFEIDAVPEEWASYIADNARFFGQSI
jgi:ferredoxin